MQYISMPTGKSGKIMQATSDAAALHILLYCPNLPLHYVVFDGVQYWFFNPHLGWSSRKEFNGHIPTLRVMPAYTAIPLNLPFKIRKIDDIYHHDYLYKYLNSIKG